MHSNRSAILPSESLINLVAIDEDSNANGPVTAATQPLLPPSKRGISEKKRKGIFYTPNKAVHLLVTWAIRSQQDIIFEPSFGGCGFLESSIVRLQDLGCTAPHERLLGCDIDPTAFAHLHELLGTIPDEAHFKLQDFLRVTPADFGQTADVVIGNPPYVSWHNMLPEQREAAASVRTATGGHLNNKGSLWTFFLAHSLRFLRPGGRMAWILPGSFLYADYAVEIRALIEKSFRHSIAIVLAQRLFIEAGTEESTVILLAEGFQSSSDAVNPLRFAAANGLAQALPVIQEWEVDKNAGLAWSRHINRLFLPAAVTTIYDRLQGSAACRELGELAKVKIGLVTGDNSFFVLTRTKAREYQLAPNLLRPIVARQIHLKGLEVTTQDLLSLEQDDAKCLLLTTANSSYKSASLKRFLATYPSQDITTNRTFAKRNPWYFISQEATPDAFLSCMNWYGPQLVINAAATTCTNTVYRVEFNNPIEATPEFRKYLAISLQSTFSQFSAEIYGRSYGSGALKLEPSEARRIALLLPDWGTECQAAFQQVDSLLRQGLAAEARRAADCFLIDQQILTSQEVTALEQGLGILRSLRRGSRRPFINQ